MKKIIGILVLFSTVIIGCKKSEQAVKTEIDEIYKIQNGVVVFKSLQAYSNFLEYSTQNDLNKFVEFTNKSENYKSISESKQYEVNTNTSRLVLGNNAETNEKIQDLLSDDFLSSMINSDGLVQIGQYLFNIDVANGKCYALHTSNLNGNNSSYYYNLILNGQSNNNFVFEFSVDDEVIEFLTNANYPSNKDVFNGVNPEVARLCGESSRRENKKKANWDFKTTNGGGYGNLSMKIVNQKAGVYFSLFAKHDLFSVGPDHIVVEDLYTWRFKPMCWAERYQYPIQGTYNAGGSQKRTAWQSTRSLSKYDMTITYFVIEIMTNNAVLISDPVQIKDGY